MHGRLWSHWNCYHLEKMMWSSAGHMGLRKRKFTHLLTKVFFRQREDLQKKKEKEKEKKRAAVAMGILVKVHYRKWGRGWASSQNRLGTTSIGEKCTHVHLEEWETLIFPFVPGNTHSLKGRKRDVLSSSVRSHLFRQIYSQPKGKIQLQMQGILFACLLTDLLIKAEFLALSDWKNLLWNGVKQRYIETISSHRYIWKTNTTY